MKKSRIAILDGYRALAIISVILFHYFSRYIPPHSRTSLYPYNDQYNYFSLGGLGVHFFFIISGFVIFYTLENTNTISEFWKKRLIRLLPSMIFTSILTYIVITIFDKENIFPKTHSFKNFFVSITFINPQLFDIILRKPPFTFNYLNESHWSLWPEIQFYCLSSLIYFLNKEKFVRNFVCFTSVLIVLNMIVKNAEGNNIFDFRLPNAFLNYYSIFCNVFNIINYISLFCSGILFFILFKDKQEGKKTTITIRIAIGALILWQILSVSQPEIRLAYILMFILFFGFVYMPRYLNVFESNLLVKVGIGSYFLYLIHENIGVLFIHLVGKYFMPQGFVFPLLLIAAFIYLSVIFTFKVDNKINQFMRNIGLRRKGEAVARKEVPTYAEN